jgi:hypothetical protein
LLAEQRAELFKAGLAKSVWVFPNEAGNHSDQPLKRTLYILKGCLPNGQKPAKARTAALPVDVWIHDIRRTVANALLNRLHVAPWIVDHVVLGHVRPKLALTYMPQLPVDDAREGLTRWADELARILGERPAPKRDEARA